MMEGWKLLNNARRWHYFKTNGVSLCGRWFTLVLTDCVQGEDSSPDNCAGCRKRREQTVARAGTGEGD